MDDSDGDREELVYLRGTQVKNLQDLGLASTWW